jgi:hypothetical protein
MTYLRTWNAKTGAELDGFNPASYSASQYLNIPLVDCHDVAVILPHTSQMPQLFYDIAEINTTALKDGMNVAGFAPASVIVVGAPASTPLFVIEYVAHVEYSFDDSSALGLAATPAPRGNSFLTDVAAEVTSMGTVALHAAGEQVSRSIKDAARQALLTAVRRIPYGVGTAVALLT